MISAILVVSTFHNYPSQNTIDLILHQLVSAKVAGFNLS